MPYYTRHPSESWDPGNIFILGPSFRWDDGLFSDDGCNWDDACNWDEGCIYEA